MLLSIKPRSRVKIGKTESLASRWNELGLETCNIRLGSSRRNSCDSVFLWDLHFGGVTELRLCSLIASTLCAKQWSRRCETEQEFFRNQPSHFLRPWSTSISSNIDWFNNIIYCPHVWRSTSWVQLSTSLLFKCSFGKVFFSPPEVCISKHVFGRSVIWAVLCLKFVLPHAIRLALLPLARTMACCHTLPLFVVSIA